jgi:hypothetical protein
MAFLKVNNCQVWTAAQTYYYGQIKKMDFSPGDRMPLGQSSVHTDSHRKAANLRWPSMGGMDLKNLQVNS